jgi:hypothetical protein
LRVTGGDGARVEERRRNSEMQLWDEPDRTKEPKREGRSLRVTEGA